MTQENEQSLAKKPEINLAKLSKGGMIVGADMTASGPLITILGGMLERITRERTEVPPQFKLPERAVYLLDPSSNRLILISNREDRGEGKTPDKYGLFAEVVELDEEGKPHFRVSSSEIVLPNRNYQSVAIGPNEFKMPPSHIDVVEEGEERKRFIPWNAWMSALQVWSNELQDFLVGEKYEGDLASFLANFDKLQREFSKKTNERIKLVFPEGNQGIDQETLPVNLIITAGDADQFLYDASLKAGFHPIFIDIEDLAKKYKELRDSGFYTYPDDPSLYKFDNYLGEEYLQDLPRGFSPAVITIDEIALHSEAQKRILGGDVTGIGLYDLPKFLQRYNSIFCRVLIQYPSFSAEPGDENNYYKRPVEAKKHNNGFYSIGYNPEMGEDYLAFLNKIKSDLLLTMFLRGGAPLTK